MKKSVLQKWALVPFRAPLVLSGDWLPPDTRIGPESESLLTNLGLRKLVGFLQGKPMRTSKSSVGGGHSNGIAGSHRSNSIVQAGREFGSEGKAIYVGVGRS